MSYSQVLINKIIAIILPDMRLIDRGTHTVTKMEMEAKLNETANEWKLG